jgi:hypothetical protein
VFCLAIAHGWLWSKDQRRQAVQEAFDNIRKQVRQERPDWARTAPLTSELLKARHPREYWYLRCRRNCYLGHVYGKAIIAWLLAVLPADSLHTDPWLYWAELLLSSISGGIGQNGSAMNANGDYHLNNFLFPTTRIRNKINRRGPELAAVRVCRSKPGGI